MSYDSPDAFWQASGIGQFPAPVSAAGHWAWPPPLFGLCLSFHDSRLDKDALLCIYKAKPTAQNVSAYGYVQIDDGVLFIRACVLQTGHPISFLPAWSVSAWMRPIDASLHPHCRRLMYTYASDSDTVCFRIYWIGGCYNTINMMELHRVPCALNKIDCDWTKCI
jgi:hypothetical protein